MCNSCVSTCFWAGRSSVDVQKISLSVEGLETIVSPCCDNTLVQDAPLCLVAYVAPRAPRAAGACVVFGRACFSGWRAFVFPTVVASIACGRLRALIGRACLACLVGRACLPLLHSRGIIRRCPGWACRGSVCCSLAPGIATLVLGNISAQTARGSSGANGFNTRLEAGPNHNHQKSCKYKKSMLTKQK